MDEVDLHYLGGMVDADGSIYIGVRKTDWAKHGYYIYPAITVTGSPHPNYQTRHRLLRELAVENGSNVDDEVHPSDGTETTTLKGQSAAATIEALVPYLREKREIAERVVEEDWSANDKGNDGRSAEEWRSLVDARTDIQEMMCGDGHTRKYDREQLLDAVGSEVQAD